MENSLDELFVNTRAKIYKCIQEKNIDVNILAFELGVDRPTFFEYMNERNDDFLFYIAALDLVKSWED